METEAKRVRDRTGYKHARWKWVGTDGGVPWAWLRNAGLGDPPPLYRCDKAGGLGFQVVSNYKLRLAVMGDQWSRTLIRTGS